MFNLKRIVLAGLIFVLLQSFTGCPARDENGKPIECTEERPCKVE